MRWCLPSKISLIPQSSGLNNVLLISWPNFCYANYNKFAWASAPFPSEASWKYDPAKNQPFYPQPHQVFELAHHAAAEILLLQLKLSHPPPPHQPLGRAKRSARQAVPSQSRGELQGSTCIQVLPGSSRDLNRWRTGRYDALVAETENMRQASLFMSTL